MSPVALLEGLILQQIIQFLAGLHQVEDVALRAVGGEEIESRFASFH